MRRILLLTLLSVGLLIAFTAVPAALFGSESAGLEASAAKNLNSSKSNIYKMTLPKKRGSQTQGGSAGLAVSDPGSPGDKAGSKKNK